MCKTLVRAAIRSIASMFSMIVALFEPSNKQSTRIMMRLAILFSLIGYLCSAAAAQTRPSYGVRSRISNAKRESSRRTFEISFSDEGTPVELTKMTLQLFPTSGELSVDAKVIIGIAFANYLKDTLTKEWKGKEFELDNVKSEVTEVKSVRARRHLQETGSEISLETTLIFEADDLSAPDDDTVYKGVEKAVKDLDKYVNDYLVPSGLDELAVIKSAEVSNFDTSGGANGINKMASQNNKAELEILIPASIAGLGVFLLTAFLISHRRRTRGDLNDSSFYDESIDNNIIIAAGSRPGKDEIEVRSPSRIRSETMNDGRTTLHIPAMMNSTTRQYASPTRMAYSSSESSVSSSSADVGGRNTERGFIRSLLQSKSFEDNREAAATDNDASLYSSDYSEGGKYFT